MRIPFIAANWKMFKTVQEAVFFAKELRSRARDIDDVEIVVAPPFTALHAVAEAVRNTKVGVAGQDLYWEREGAFTGQVSGPMLKEAGAEYVIVGHSERRTLFGETDATVNRKTLAAFAAGLTPIVCIGETLAERERNETFSVLDRQLRDAMAELGADRVRSLILAYEPVWAIGTGKNATAGEAQEAHAHIRRRLAEAFGPDAATDCHIIYGGSVKPANARDLISQEDVDGALVGGASLDLASFLEIVAKSRPVPV